MALYGFGGQEIVEKVDEVHVWFDKWNTQVWHTSLYDAEGNYIDESATAYYKSDAKNYAIGMVNAIKREQGHTPTLKLFTRDGVAQ